MRLAKKVEVEALALAVQTKRNFDCSPEDVERVLLDIDDALEDGVRLNSGDGFRYYYRNHRLVCHDGCRLKGSLCYALGAYVWGQNLFIQIVADLIDETQPLTDVLPDYFYRLIQNDRDQPIYGFAK